MASTLNFKERLREWESEQLEAAQNEGKWSKQKCQKELDDAKVECEIEKAMLHVTNAFDAPDKIRAQMFTQFQNAFNKKVRLNERLRSFKYDQDRKQNELQASLQNKSIKPLLKDIQNKIDLITIKLDRIAHHYKAIEDYNRAISFYSRAILQLSEWIRKYGKQFNYSDDMYKHVFTIAVHQKYANLLSNRADCLWEIGKYEKSLRDLNKIVTLCIMKKDRIEDQKCQWYFEMTETLGSAHWQRHKIWLKLGNSASAMNDLQSLSGFEVKLDTLTDMASDKMHQLVDMGVSRHPSKVIVETAMSERYDKSCLKLNKYSVDGWNLLQPKHKALGKRHGHIMFEYDNSVYVFGGTCVEFGGLMVSSQFQRKMDDKLRFFKIDIDVDTNTYVSKILRFPDKMKYCLIGKETGIRKMGWKRMLTVQIWKNKMVVFGGYNNPYRNVLIYNFDTQYWCSLNVKNMPKYLSKCERITNHSAVIINNIMYVFGGEFDGEETNMFCSLNLVTKKWKIITRHNVLNMYKDAYIPGSRFDHIMWKDWNFGANGSVYIAYGNHYRKGIYSEIHRLDMWRFDIFEEKWYEIEIMGNSPVYRAECGFTSNTNDGIILFGGYSSMLMHINLDSKRYNGYNFFGDCYEYLSKQQKWIMIQSEIYPLHRAYAAMCVMKKKNILCLYGGYYGGNSEETKVYDDIWILDLNALKYSKRMNNNLRSCSTCSKTENDLTLFRCKGTSDENGKKCVQFYCSKYCQKRDWIEGHRTLCRRMLI